MSLEAILCQKDQPTDHHPSNQPTEIRTDRVKLGTQLLECCINPACDNKVLC